MYVKAAQSFAADGAVWRTTAENENVNPPERHAQTFTGGLAASTVSVVGHGMASLPEIRAGEVTLHTRSLNIGMESIDEQGGLSQDHGHAITGGQFGQRGVACMVFESELQPG